LLLALGCVVNQAREVQTWRRVLDGDRPSPVAPFVTTETLTLRRAFALANAHNEQLALAGEDYLQAMIDKDRAFASFLPTISFAPTYMRQEKTGLAAANPMIASFVPEKTRDVPFQGQWFLHPFRNVPLVWASRRNVQRERALLLDRQAIVLLDVAQTFFQVARSEKQAQVLENSVQVQRQRVRDMQVWRRAGTARPVDVAQTEAQLAHTRNALIQARNDVRNGRAMLAFLIGAPAVEGPLEGGWEVPPAGGWRIQPLLALAAEHRQDLQAAHATVMAAANLLQSAWGQYFPSVSLNLTYYLSRQTFPNDVDWTSLLAVNVPIFSAGLTHADVRAAYSRLRQAYQLESSARREVLKDLRVALEDLIGDEQRLEQLDIETRAAREALRQADAAFRAGMGTNLERLVAQDQWLTAELALTSEQFQRSVDYLRLLRVTGVLDVGLTASLPAGAARTDAADALSTGTLVLSETAAATPKP
jgi:outer membrane protein TolC